MTFRRAAPADAEAISALIMSFRELLTVEPSGSGAEKFFAAVSAEAERSYILSDRYDYLVAEVDGELAGFIAMRDQSHLFHLFVSRKHQRRGLARELWRRAREAAVAQRPSAGFTVNSSVSAVPVYERLGFKTCAPAVHEEGVVFVPMRDSDAESVPRSGLRVPVLTR